MKKGWIIIIILLIGLFASTGSLMSIKDVSHKLRTTSVTVISPNGGEKWEQGQTYPIVWKSRNVNNVMIELEKNNSEGWDLVYAAPSSSAEKKIYVTVVGGFDSGNDYKIKIWDTNDPRVGDSSNDYFSIVPVPMIPLVGKFTGIINIDLK